MRAKLSYVLACCEYKKSLAVFGYLALVVFSLTGPLTCIGEYTLRYIGSIAGLRTTA